MKERILNYMKEHGSITTWEAFERLGCTRLSEYIRQIRQEHRVLCEDVSRINRYGEKVYYKKFMLGD